MAAGGGIEAALRGYIDDLAWTPPTDAIAVKKLRAQISIGFKDVLKTTCSTPRDAAKRSWAFSFLNDVSKGRILSSLRRSKPSLGLGDGEIACLVAKTGLLERALALNLDLDPCEQEVLLEALNLLHSIADHVPESKPLAALCGQVLKMASDTRSLRGVQILALRVLAQLCYSQVSRRWVSQELTEEKARYQKELQDIDT